MILACSLKHVEGYHRVIVEQNRLIGNDEPHATHVCGETVHVLTTGSNFDAVLEDAEIDFVKFVAEFFLFHELVFLPVGTYYVAAL